MVAMESKVLPEVKRGPDQEEYLGPRCIWIIVFVSLFFLSGCEQIQSDFQKGQHGGVQMVRKARSEGLVSIGLVRANVLMGNYLKSGESPDYMAGWRKGVDDELKNP
jgi:hypothetical protein